ncbi:LPS export ABC transporter periplasmic protein LptC [Roseobacteraceae bacterium S113]
MALGILSTLFLLARTLPEETRLPYVEDLKQRGDSADGMRASFFTGSTAEGDALAMQASSIRPDPTDPERTMIANVAAHVQYTDGSELHIVAQDGVFNELDDSLLLRGDVHIDSSTGYEIRTSELLTEMKSGRAETTGRVDATGPAGTLEAGKMVITRPEDAAAHLVFTQGVKLVYQRQDEKE